MSPPLTITVQTFSDTLCPWCYIGKKNLDRAMETYKAEHPDVQFELTWNPFYLNSKAKVSGKPFPPPLPHPPLPTIPLPISYIPPPPISRLSLYQVQQNDVQS